MMDLRAIYPNNDVLEISMFDFVDIDHDPLMTMLLNQYVHESWFHMQDENKTKALSCVDCEVTIFTSRNSKYHSTFAMFYKLDALTPAITDITDIFSWASALSDPNIIFLSSGLSVLSNL